MKVLKKKVKSKFLNLRLNKEMFDRIQNEAITKEITVSALIRQLIREHIEMGR